MNKSETMRAVPAGRVTFIGSWAVVDDQGAVWVATGHQDVAERVAELLQEHGMMAVPDRVPEGL